MTCAEVWQLKRSYDRNLGWCRFWLGVSLAVATLTFSFAVDEVFDPVFGSDAETSATDTHAQAVLDDATQPAPVGFTSVTVISILVLLVSICVGLSAIFQALYRRNDRVLTATEHHPQEATP